MTILGSTDIGLTRATNQDCYRCASLTEHLAYGVLCDGMGGENGGEVAAGTAADFAADMLRRELREDMSEVSLRAVLSSAIAGANALVFDRAQQDAGLSGMGTTIILAVLLRDTLYLASVGDSRAYLFAPAGSRQLTKDHTIVQMLVDIGEITEEDALVHPKRHYITRAVGVSATVEPDFLVESVGPEDIVLLCSDGLYPHMAPDVTYRLLRECVSTESASPLIDLALAAGSTDNITAVVMTAL